ncbi:MAG: 3'-phosphoesterase [Methanomassiliicoccales archaeon]|nr:3'-phosphoesterase [Methanomassiliicoccales archaeon]NYT14414.1 3'-phosphoesterase [Methanomassiliicoccales archaeon]
MRLEEYMRKRDFDATPEPMGARGNHDVSIFVVQEHHASHLHWDFRLSLNGILRSWAVPKGIPDDVGVKHLAVETEDHPIEYADFEGEIPEGRYGAGKVEIWDKGEYNLLEKEEGKIVISLEGKKLKGKFALIRFGGREKEKKNWLIMKLSGSSTERSRTLEVQEDHPGLEEKGEVTKNGDREEKIQ